MLRSLASTLTFTEWNGDEKSHLQSVSDSLASFCPTIAKAVASEPRLFPWNVLTGQTDRNTFLCLFPSTPRPPRFPERCFFCMSGMCLLLELKVGGGFGWLWFWLGWLWCCISGLPAFGSWSKNLKILENSCLVASFKHTGNHAGRPFYSILTQLPGSLRLSLWIKNSDLQQSTDTSPSLSLSLKDMACMKNKNCITCKKLPALGPWKHRSPTLWV